MFSKAVQKYEMHEDYQKTLDEMLALREAVLTEQRSRLANWKPHLHSKEFKDSAANLAAYLGLRHHDVRNLQARLALLGLSSLGRSEAHVLATLDAVIHALQLIVGQETESALRKKPMSDLHLRRNTNLLLGEPPEKRWVRIMVTLPSDAAINYPLVRDMVQRGMDCARINCAHDDEIAWAQMAENVRRAESECGRSCKILMDLAGPKLRTGPVAETAAILRIKPEKDETGQVVRPAEIILDSSGGPGYSTHRDSMGFSAPARISVDAKWLQTLNPRDEVHFRDTLGKHRLMIVSKRLSDHEMAATCDAGAYIKSGTILQHASLKKHHENAEQTVVGKIIAAPVPIRLMPGAPLRLTRSQAPGNRGTYDDEKSEYRVAPYIPCIPSEIIDRLEPGQRVWIDDGKIGTVVELVDSDGARLRVVHARPTGEKLAAEKGLNFPDTELRLPPLTEKDLADLDFAVKHADIVGYSFVQDAAGMDKLVAELDKRNGQHLGIIAKIETRAAIRNLPDIMIHGGGSHPFGVMIARGDLALEIGYERLAEIQEEILWLCEAAHVPVIWATQVLEGLVKNGIPSRAEITDAAMSERAECVMLNKGPFILRAISVLDNVVNKMQAHQRKKTSQLRALQW